jgi:hypothetical protein
MTTPIFDQLQAIHDWTAANHKARNEYQTHPFAIHNPDCDSGDYDLMCVECREQADAARCRHCSGTGVFEDETISRACPYCDATGESRDQ